MFGKMRERNGGRSVNAGRLLTGLLALAFLLVLAMPLNASAGNITSGTLGDNNGITWSYDADTKTLTVTGEDSGVYGSYNSSTWRYESPFTAISSDVEKIVMKDCTLQGSACALFANLGSLKEIEFDNFDTSKVTNMSNMFSDCSSLESLDLSSFDTSNVTNMSSMFNDCSSLESLNLSNFDTSKVSNMSGIFWFCSSMESLDVSNFDTSKVIDMSDMFYGCSSLESLDLSGFDTSNVTDMGWMFARCSNLKKLDVSSFDTSNVTDADYMLYKCDKLATIYTPKKLSDAQGIALPCEFCDEEENSTAYITAEFCNKELTTTKPIFFDVPEEKWYFTHVKKAYINSLMDGTGTDAATGLVIFKPETEMTRAMFVQVLYSMAGKPTVSYTDRFSDISDPAVDASAWYSYAVLWAAENGITSGQPDGSFGVNIKITREQMALMLMKYAEALGGDVSGRADLTDCLDTEKISPYATDAMAWARDGGVMSGASTDKGIMLNPQNNATRAEGATMLNAFYEKYISGK